MSEHTHASTMVGRCGDRAPTLRHGFDAYREICMLPHGHPGWHRADTGCEWTAGDERPTLVPVADADELRAYLDGLNESGINDKAAGIDAVGQPFLVTLVGPYADTEAVFFVSPWDGEVNHPHGELCNECGAANSAGIEDVRYPAHILQAPTEAGAFGMSEPEHHRPDVAPDQDLINAATVIQRVAQRPNRHPATAAILLPIAQDLRARAVASRPGATSQ